MYVVQMARILPTNLKSKSMILKVKEKKRENENAMEIWSVALLKRNHMIWSCGKKKEHLTELQLLS